MKFRYYILLLLIPVVLLTACQRKEFIDDLRGKWSITEITYNQNGLVTVQHPTDLTMEFSYSKYFTWLGDSLTETGTYTVNGTITQVIFWQGTNEFKYKILDHSDTYQHWKREIMNINLIIEFKMDKLE